MANATRAFLCVFNACVFVRDFAWVNEWMFRLVNADTDSWCLILPDYVDRSWWKEQYNNIQYKVSHQSHTTPHRVHLESGRYSRPLQNALGFRLRGSLWLRPRIEKPIKLSCAPSVLTGVKSPLWIQLLGRLYASALCRQLGNSWMTLMRPWMWLGCREMADSRYASSVYDTVTAYVLKMSQMCMMEQNIGIVKTGDTRNKYEC